MEQLSLEVLHEDCMFCNWGTCFTSCNSKNPLAGPPWLQASPLPVAALGLPLLLQFSPFQQWWLGGPQVGVRGWLERAWIPGSSGSWDGGSYGQYALGCCS